MNLDEFHDAIAGPVRQGLESGLAPEAIADAIRVELDEIDLVAEPAVISEPVVDQSNNDNDRRVQPAATICDCGRTLDITGQRGRYDNLMHQSRHGTMPAPDDVDLSAFAALIVRDFSQPWPSGPCFDRLRAAGFIGTDKDAERGDRIIATLAGKAALSARVPAQ